MEGLAATQENQPRMQFNWLIFSSMSWREKLCQIMFWNKSMTYSLEVIFNWFVGLGFNSHEMFFYTSKVIHKELLAQNLEYPDIVCSVSLQFEQVEDKRSVRTGNLSITDEQYLNVVSSRSKK